MGEFMHDVEGELMCTSVNEKIPYFNAPIYLENKTPVGKVDEILGPITQVYFTIKPSEGIQAKSFKKGDKFYIGGDKLLPLDKYVPFPFSCPTQPLLCTALGQKLEYSVSSHGRQYFGRLYSDCCPSTVWPKEVKLGYLRHCLDPVTRSKNTTSTLPWSDTS
jgi:rRNA processing protein Gar1